jgi:hypothetical protein
MHKLAVFGAAALVACGHDDHVAWVHSSSLLAADVAGCLTTHATLDRDTLVVHVRYVARPPCVVLATPHVVLEGTVGGDIPDPGQHVVMLGSGRFITTIDGANGILAVWNTVGEFLHTISGPGSGPGEISPRGVTVLIAGGGDTLLVLDASNRWTVFDSVGNFVRTFPGTHTGRYSGSIIRTADGNLLTGGGVSGGASTQYFRLVDGQGKTVRSFGEIEGTDVPRSLPDLVRKVAAAGDGSFWASPVHGQQGGLVLERWTNDGRMLRRMTYDLPWLPADGYPATGDPQEPILPEYQYVNVDSAGMLWVAVAVRDRRWRRTPPAQRERRAQHLYDGRLIVASAESGVVLASHLYDGPEDPLPPFARMIPGTRLSYRLTRGDDGRSRIEFFQLGLIRGQ